MPTKAATLYSIHCFTGSQWMTLPL